jgi:hypothetical protein
MLVRTLAHGKEQNGPPFNLPVFLVSNGNGFLAKNSPAGGNLSRIASVNNAVAISVG